MDQGLKLNQNHWAALIFTIIAWVTGWFALVLVTAKYGAEDKFGELKVTRNQYIGLAFSLLIAVFVWLKNVYAIQGDDVQQK